LKNLTTEELQELAGQLQKPTGEKGIQTAFAMNRSNADMNELAFTVVDPQSQDQILEIGMGNGILAKEFVAKDCFYTGLDYSEDMVAEAKKRNAELVEEKKAQFHHGEMTELPFGVEAFNSILTVNTIYFIEDIEKAFLEFHRVLKPGGKCVIGIRPEENLRQFPSIDNRFIHRDEFQIEQLLFKTGFDQVLVHPFTEANKTVGGHEFEFKCVIIQGIKN
jgi:SAM-dependent methyltransferase